MSVFPVVTLGPDFFLGYDRSVMPRSREAALRHALCERAILTAEPPSDPRLDLRRPVRVCPGASGPSVWWREWENSPLGATFPATVVQQGQAVREALEPAFQANVKLRIVDPFLTPPEGDRMLIEGSIPDFMQPPEA